MDKVLGFKVIGDIMNVSFATLKDALPLITKYKDKTNFNEIILGKWQTKKK